MDGWRDGEARETRTRRSKIVTAQSSSRNGPLCAVKKGFGERHQKRTETCRATGRASHISESQERAWCLQNELMTIGFFFSFFTL